VRLGDAQALALRRAAFAAAAIAATLAAHRAQDDAMVLSAGCLPVLLSVVCIAVLTGPRHGTFSPRGPATTLVVLIVAQALLHLTMSAAPWVFGLTLHHTAALVGTRSLVAHLIAALVLTAVLHWWDRVLAGAVSATRVMRRLLRGCRRRGSAPGVLRVRVVDRPALRTVFAPACPTRGPPVIA
jgi:hypothetical protein